MMSLHTVTSRLFAVKPRVWSEGRRLRARTSLFWQALSLFSYGRDLTVDKARREIRVQTRYFWLFRRERTIAFDEVAYIDYSYSGLGTSWGWNLSGWGRTDEVDQYSVALVLDRARERVPLFRFYGEGAVETGWGGVLFGDDSIVDFAGDQMEASKRFVDILGAMLGVSLGPPVPHVARADGTRLFCLACGRPSPPNKTKCQYCGGELEAKAGRER